jgi:hypothetical protein
MGSGLEDMSKHVGNGELRRKQYKDRGGASKNERYFKSSC